MYVKGLVCQENENVLGGCYIAESLIWTIVWHINVQKYMNLQQKENSIIGIKAWFRKFNEKSYMPESTQTGYMLTAVTHNDINSSMYPPN